jgi:hypothetical protein
MITSVTIRSSSEAAARRPRDATRGGVNAPALPVQRGRESPLLIDPFLADVARRGLPWHVEER